MSAAVLTPGAISFRQPVLPWSNAAADERRFRRILGLTLVLALLWMLALPWLPIPSVEQRRAEVLPPPLAKLLLDKPISAPPALVPPPPAATDAARPEPAPPKADKPDAAPPKPAPRTDKPEPTRARAPVPEARDPVPGKPPGEVAVEQARRRASGVGLLAEASQIASLAAAPAAVQLRQDIQKGPGVGTSTGAGVGAGKEEGVPERAMITAAAGRTSGGLNNAAVSRDTGGGGLAGRATTVVEGTAGGGGGGGPGSVAGTGRGPGKGGAGTGAGAGGQVARGGGARASRALEDVKLVFERNKGAIYALYNRALRDEPSLQGKVVLELKIAPDGQVTACRVVSSDLKNEDLERKLVARVRSFDFGAKEVEPMVVSWPVDFLPS